MLSTLIIFIIIILGLLYITSGYNPLSGTASICGEIWSGTCRLSCRPTGFSQHSGLQQSSKAASISHECICTSCPCELIENILRTCAPATQFYNTVSETMSCYYYNCVKVVTESYESVTRFLESDEPCQRDAQAQLVRTENYFESTENITFVPQERRNLLPRADPSYILGTSKTAKSILVTSSSKIASASVTFGETAEKSLTETKSDKKIKDAAKSAKLTTDRKNKELSKPDKNSNVESEKVLRIMSRETMQSSSGSHCPKCRAEGKTCIPDCPKGKK